MVVYSDENFDNKNDILTRYETLERIAQDIRNNIQNNESEIEKIKHSLSTFNKVKIDEVITQLQFRNHRMNCWYSVDDLHITKKRMKNFTVNALD